MWRLSRIATTATSKGTVVSGDTGRASGLTNRFGEMGTRIESFEQYAEFIATYMEHPNCRRAPRAADA